MAVGPLVVHVARLRRSLGTIEREELTAPLDSEMLAPATVADCTVPDGADAECDLVLESYPGGVMVTGTVAAPWVGVCRRCTVPVAGRLDISVKERFCDPPPRGEPEDEEAYPIVDEAIDLGPLVHEAILGELPMAAKLGPAPTVVQTVPGRAPNRTTLETDDGRPEEEELQSQGPQPSGRQLAPRAARPQHLPAVPDGEGPPRGLPQLRLVQGSDGGRGRLICPATGNARAWRHWPPSPSRSTR